MTDEGCPVKSTRITKAEQTKQLYLFDANERTVFSSIIGVDEAGRGPLCGPVVAAAVCLDGTEPISGINDSKKLNEQTREALYEQIVSSSKAWAVGIASPQEIDSINILRATFYAMKRAIDQLEVPWKCALVDGNQLIAGIPPAQQKTVVKGDGLSASIAAASIVAKVTRDRIMLAAHEQFPQYNFDRHKGYGTADHIARIREHGLCPIHRKSFCQQLILQTELVF